MTAALEARGLTVERGDQVVLSDVDLRVEPGEVVILAGPSGGGKSTLLQALAGLLTALPATRVEGTVRLGGLDVASVPPATLARRFGFLFQRPEDQLLSLDVASEVRAKLLHLGATPAEAAARGREALERLGIPHLEDRDTATLSGGEAKRVALAAALASDPAVLLLDEPLGDLDPAARRRLLADLRALPAGTTVVAATHRLDALRPLATGALLVADGRVVAAGSRVPSVAPRTPAPRHREPALLRFEDVTAGPDRNPLIQGLQLDLDGGLVAVAGPNGAGKTTLLRLATGLLQPRQGRVLLRGTNLASMALRARAREVGYVPQDPELLFFAPTAAQEVAFGPRTLGVPAEPSAILAEHGLAGLAERHPQALSGGERERLAWAAALAHGPPVAAFDEPTAGLDDAGRRTLLRHLGRLRARGLALVATHDPDLLALADRVVLLSAGTGVADGPPTEILAPRVLQGLAHRDQALSAFALPQAVAP